MFYNIILFLTDLHLFAKTFMFNYILVFNNQDMILYYIVEQTFQRDHCFYGNSFFICNETTDASLVPSTVKTSESH